MSAALPLSIGIACDTRPETDPEFDAAAVVREVDSVMGLMVEHLEALEFDRYERYYASSEILTVAKDGEFYPTGDVYLAELRSVTSRMSSISSFEWLERRIYPLARSAAVVNGRYRELIGWSDRDPVENLGTWTATFQKTNGAWRIVSEHISHPR